MRHWWLIFVLYLTGVIFNLITLAAQYGLTALLNFSKVAQALLLPRLVQLLEQQLWMAVLWVVMVVIVILLGYWAHKDREFEHTVLTLREDQKRQSKTHDELEKQVRKIAHPITASGIGNIASSGPVINSPISNTFITNNFNLEDKKSPSVEAQAVAIERTQFEAYLKAGPKRQSLVGDEATFYVEPTLLWQQDMDQNQNLRDPDARDTWLNIIGKLPSVSLMEVLEYKHVLIVGEFNVGKTLLIERLRDVALQQSQAKLEDSDHVGSANYVPILLPLRYYQNAAETFLAYIQRIFREIYWDVSSAGVLEVMPTDAILRTCSYIFLFDGLDELGGSQSMELLKNIRYFIGQYPQHKYIFSSRQLAYGVSEAVFANVEHETLLITPFSRQQIQLYLIRRGLAGTPLEEALWQRRDLLGIARIPGTLKALCDIGGIPGNLPPSLSGAFAKYGVSSP